MSLAERLKDWRDRTARREGVEPYFVLHYDTLEAIARQRPVTREALSEIKGMGPKKIETYGRAILSMVTGEHASPEAAPANGAIEPRALTVSQYLGGLNELLAQQLVRLRGEVGRVNERDHGVYFEFRDPQGTAVLTCLVFADRYQLMGVTLREGMELIVEGYPSVYPRTGRFTFRAETLELVGEGKLQQSYLALKRRLEAEGLFAPERKREIPQYVHRIGLITSSHADAYFDFVKNLLPAGLTVEHIDCHVEGARAIPEIIRALKTFHNRPIDVIVLVRGGGSWEALQAFNSEAVCRAIADSRAPVLAGIGHERDIPLAALTSDRYVSTPSLTATELCRPWREAPLVIVRAAQTIHRTASLTILHSHGNLRATAKRILLHYRHITTWVPQRAAKILSAMHAVRERLYSNNRTITETRRRITAQLHSSITAARTAYLRLQQLASARNPDRMFTLGYSIVRNASSSIIRSSSQLTRGDPVELQFGDGRAAGTITDITKHV